MVELLKIRHTFLYLFPKYERSESITSLVKMLWHFPLPTGNNKQQMESIPKISSKTATFFIFGHTVVVKIDGALVAFRY